MKTLNDIKKSTIKLTRDVAKQCNDSHVNVLYVLSKTHMLAMVNGYNRTPGIIKHTGKTVLDGCTMTTVVETTNEKIAKITTEAVHDGKIVAVARLVNTAENDKETNWVIAA